MIAQDGIFVKLDKALVVQFTQLSCARLVMEEPTKSALSHPKLNTEGRCIIDMPDSDAHNVLLEDPIENYHQELKTPLHQDNHHQGVIFKSINYPE